MNERTVHIYNWFAEPCIAYKKSRSITSIWGWYIYKMRFAENSESAKLKQNANVCSYPELCVSDS